MLNVQAVSTIFYHILYKMSIAIPDADMPPFPDGERGQCGKITDF